MRSATHMSQSGLAWCDSTGQHGTAGLKIVKAVLLSCCFYQGSILILLLITLYAQEPPDCSDKNLWRTDEKQRCVHIQHSCIMLT